MKIQIESVSMNYEGNDVVSVRVDHSVKGKVMRSGRGSLELTAKQYKGNESVPKLEKMIREALTKELKEELEDKKEGDEDAE